MTIEVIKPGLSTTVQDLGRPGYYHLGIPLSGAMDRAALRAANLLVGNPEGAAALELTFLGPELRFTADAVVAVHATGAAANRPRNHTYFPVEDPRHPGFRYRFKSQEGGNVASGVWALRITSDMAGTEMLAGGVKRRRLLPLAAGGTFCGLITLYSMERLEPLAIIHDSYIQKMRVGATSALGIRELANELGIDRRGELRRPPPW